MSGSSLRCLILKHLSLLLLAVSLAPSVFAKDVDNNNISSATHIALKLISTLPDSGVKNGLQRYYQILDPAAYSTDKDIAVSNAGVSGFFQLQFERNQCFAEKALLFYRDIRNTTRSTQKTDNNLLRHSRPALGDTAGGTRKDLKAGWLYNRALQYTRGNANAALTLIGMCGHDDQKQGDFLNDEAEISLSRKGLIHEDLYRTTSDEGVEETPCPAQTSDFFVARALSEKADISEGLKKKILSVQYPGKAPTQVASKNYHVLGAAFMTCQMIEAGLSPFLAIRVETMAANLYRGIRLCQDIEQPASLFWKLQTHPEIKKRSFQERFEEAVLRTALERGRRNTCTYTKAREDALCELLMRAGAPADFTSLQNEERGLAALKIYLDKMIASGLYSSWAVNGQVAGVSLPCSRDQLLGPHPFMKWLVAQANWPLNICGRGLSVETCRKALGVIRTWEVDFDWTVSQHKVGAEFAASVCKQYPKGRQSIQSFCER